MPCFLFFRRIATYAMAIYGPCLIVRAELQSGLAPRSWPSPWNAIIALQVMLR